MESMQEQTDEERTVFKLLVTIKMTKNKVNNDRLKIFHW